MVGTRLGPYGIVGLLGAGGMGEVYRARDPRLDRDVALKVLSSGSPADRTARARLVREARKAARLSHPNVCTIYEVGEADGHVYIAMELVQGRPLDEVLAEPPPPGTRSATGRRSRALWPTPTRAGSYTAT
ncbi:MAG TPA: protein kinase [Vicinamibacterales bacterium]|nr:protein kinase [Vicinamibacterales bacterium]HOQ59322.1 protein kinase [Vicinamibacterales bacterium]HPK71898.1 protein kinase [Vicinamibacterales bacterium]